MKAPLTKVEQAERVVVVPEAAPRRGRPSPVLVAGVLAALIGLAAGGGIVWAIQRDSVNESEAAAAQAARDLGAAETRAAAAEARLEDLSDDVASLRQELATAKLGLRVIGASKQEARRLVDELRLQLEGERSRLATMIGPGLADGRYLGRMVAVGSSQSPPRIVLDLERWLTGRAAVRAARADGSIGPHQALHPKRYARNLDPTWRIIEASPFADVVIRVGKGARVRTHITLGRLETLLNRQSSPAERIAGDPFWIVIRDGRVAMLQQQPYEGP